MKMTRILFVCAANKNRSPAAEFIYNQLADGAESAGFSQSKALEERTVSALKKKYGDSPWAKGLEAFLNSFKPRRLDAVSLNHFEEVYAMDKQLLGFLAKQCPSASLFPPNGVKDPAAIYPTKTGDPFLDALNEVEAGVRLMLADKRE